jgi:hypothetical protein
LQHSKEKGRLAPALFICSSALCSSLADAQAVQGAYAAAAAVAGGSAQAVLGREADVSNRGGTVTIAAAA